MFSVTSEAAASLSFQAPPPRSAKPDPSKGTDSFQALIDGSALVVLKRVNGVTTRLGASRFTALGGKTYTLHFRAIGATLFASAWPGDQPEPANWMIVVSDMSLVSGQGGVRVVLQNNTVIHVASFLETAANSGI